MVACSPPLQHLLSSGSWSSVGFAIFFEVPLYHLIALKGVLEDPQGWVSTSFPVLDAANRAQFAYTEFEYTVHRALWHTYIYLCFFLSSSLGLTKVDF